MFNSDFQIRPDKKSQGENYVLLDYKLAAQLQFSVTMKLVVPIFGLSKQSDMICWYE